MFNFINEISAMPVYRYGLMLFALLAIVPAIVSGNMAQHLASKLTKNQIDMKTIKQLALNLVVFIGCVSLILFTLITYLR